MIRPTETVSIIPTDELSRMHLSGLAGRRGVVAEAIFGSDTKLIGYMVLLEKSFQGEHLWFIPEDAVRHEEDPE